MPKIIRRSTAEPKRKEYSAGRANKIDEGTRSPKRNFGKKRARKS